jgi:nitroimidazol reductase NimA-like FMN-containing flavoprotein (pyridoxamine 5'-phosphate oxidase superfamily)
MLRNLREGVQVCVTATILDGLVLARSAFHHSMNYRSAVVFGTAREITADDEKRAALHALVEHVVRGRAAESRPPNEKELRGTMVLALPITEASAKVRTGAPVDDEEDYELPVWAGVLPMRLVAGEPIADAGISAEVPVYLRDYTR